jgi:hypothetical protein
MCAAIGCGNLEMIRTVWHRLTAEDQRSKVELFAQVALAHQRPAPLSFLLTLCGVKVRTRISLFAAKAR